ncbi:MAG: PocR ligand-binding domain-containing protein [Candidatus Omnitrophica bacterium]|nr:PocR ligand-binding domain-containing protein [Candidatus Omnitrophota bacterium]
MIDNKWLLSELVSLEEWQHIQDLISEVLEVTLCTVSREGNVVTKTSRPNRLCNELLPGNTNLYTFCGNCLLGSDIKKPITIKKTTNFKCPFGLDIFMVPIKAVSEDIVTYVVVGPVILKYRKEASVFEEQAKKAGLSLEELTDALIDINVFTYNKLYSITQLVESIFGHIAQTGYHKKRLGELAPALVAMDPLFSRYYEEKILSALLNSCTLALDADSGSVMTLDKNTDSLHIKVSQKLDEDVVSKTNLKMGEGIAGLVAQTAQPIILPKDQDKKGLSGKLKRKDIKSSMIIPFSKLNSENAKDLYGVINLNMIRREKDFSEKDITLVKELTNLASIALAAIQYSSTDDVDKEEDGADEEE